MVEIVVAPSRTLDSIITEECEFHADRYTEVPPRSSRLDRTIDLDHRMSYLFAPCLLADVAPPYACAAPASSFNTICSSSCSFFCRVVADL